MVFCSPPTRTSRQGSFRGCLLASAVIAASVAGLFVPSARALQGQALHERKHDAKRQVEALEEQWRKAELDDDADTMDKLLSDDYIGISMTGQVNTKAQQLDRMKAHKLMLTRIDLGEMQVKLVGSIAIVTSRAEVEGTIEGEPMKGIFRYTRVYQRRPTGVWKITSFEATRVPGLGDRGRHIRSDDSKAAASLPSSGPS
ncbi:MAG: nuclear transport factor 2 family protein [Acidobacteriota bacterium]|nr:nuclear transport factor 2 family protein [Acidobacteriota bacterium]